MIPGVQRELGCGSASLISSSISQSNFRILLVLGVAGALRLAQ
jgi:hypothetical protein